LFQVDTIDGHTEFLYVLVEHKSYRDGHVAIQLLEYIALIYRRWVNQFGSVGSPVPELTVIVVYHGVEPWNVPTRFSGLYENPGKASRLSVDFGYVLLDLCRISIRSMPEHAELRAGLAVLRHSKCKVLSVEDAELIAKVLKMSDRSFRHVAVDYLDRAYRDGPRKVFFDTASKIIMEDVDMFASAAEKYTSKGHREGLREGIEQGVKQGVKQGIEQGVEQGMARLLTLQLTQRFGTVSRAVRNRIRKADGKNLDTWAIRLLHAQTIDEVFAE